MTRGSWWNRRRFDERHGAKTVSHLKQFSAKLKRLRDEQASLRCVLPPRTLHNTHLGSIA
jgi:hypothetical protein